jgi:hypothetical protein
LERGNLQIRQSLRKIVAYLQHLSWYILAIITIVFIVYFKYFYFHIISFSSLLFALTIVLFGIQTLEKILFSLDEKSEVFNTHFQGEVAIVNILQKLPPEYLIFHDLQIEAKRKVKINHLVIGPTGIFVIELKVFSRIGLLGHKTRINKKLKKVAKRVNDKVVFVSQLVKKVTGQTYTVKPILVVTPSSLSSHILQNITLTTPKRVNETLMSNPIILDNSQLKRLAFAFETYFSLD